MADDVLPFGCCLRCDYPLFDRECTLCPECGQSYDVDDRRSICPYPKRSPRACRWFWATITICVVAVGATTVDFIIIMGAMWIMDDLVFAFLILSPYAIHALVAIIFRRRRAGSIVVFVFAFLLAYLGLVSLHEVLFISTNPFSAIFLGALPVLQWIGVAMALTVATLVTMLMPLVYTPAALVQHHR